MAKEKHGVLTGIYKKDGGRRKLPKIYITWAMMKQRCFNKKHIAYERYGERGISVSKEWMTFENFYNDMKEGFEEHLKTHGAIQTTLERVDNDKGYCKENCTWATRKEQANNIRNNIRNNITISIDGVKKSKNQWKRETGIDLYSRVKMGWDEKDLLKNERAFYKTKLGKVVASHKEFFVEFEDYISLLPERWVNIIEYRFALKGGEVKSLRQCGIEFSLTKERIRQIIKQAMGKISEKIDKQKNMC